MTAPASFATLDAAGLDARNSLSDGIASMSGIRRPSFIMGCGCGTWARVCGAFTTFFGTGGASITAALGAAHDASVIPLSIISARFKFMVLNIPNCMASTGDDGFW